MKSFTIVVDSNCDLPPNYAEKHGIEVLPMPFELDGKAHNQGYWQEISAKDFYTTLRNGGIAKTSQINSWLFEKIFLDYAKQGKSALFLLLSSGLSATFQTASSALQGVKKSYPNCDISLVDSIAASLGHGLLAMLAVQRRKEGMSASETAAWLEERKHRCIGLFTVDDLMYLHRGGRLSKLSAIAGSVLGVKPVLNLAPDGTLALKNKVRGRHAALKLMVNQLKECTGDSTLDTVIVCHTDSLDDSETLVSMVKEAVKVREVINMTIGPVIGAHLGPGAVVLFFETRMTRTEYEKKFYKQ